MNKNIILKFKNWIEVNNIDCIDSATIYEFCEIFKVLPEEQEILERRFL